MKPIQYIAMASLVAFAACDLTETPIDKYNAETFYTDANSMVIGVNGCYNTLSNIAYYGGTFWRGLDYYGDDGNGAADGIRNLQGIAQSHALDSENTSLTAIWAQIYNSINRCNGVIYRVTQQEWTPNTALDSVRHRVMGEARFIRALGYFNLVRTFGEVPLRKEYSYDVVNQWNAPLASRKEVLDYIIEDLKFAQQYCWNRGEVMSGQTNTIGRATKLAATALLAKVYLHIASSVRVAYTAGFYDGDSFNPITGINHWYKHNYQVGKTGYSEADAQVYYDLCVKECNKGIAHPDFYIEPTWSDLWKVENKYSKEFIFAAQFTNVVDYYSNYPRQFLPVLCTLGANQSTGTEGAQTPQHKIHDAFLRIRNGLQVGSDTVAGNPKYMNLAVDTSDTRFKEGYLVKFTKYRDAAGIDYRFVYFDTNGAFDVNYRKYTNGINVGSVIDQASCLFSKKYQDPQSPNQSQSQTGVPILRSVDLYYMRAEAKAELSGFPADGFADINSARQRISCSRKLVDQALINEYYPMPGDPNQGAMGQFRSFIVRERMSEFANEGDRFFTIQRLGCYLYRFALTAKERYCVGKASAVKERFSNTPKPYRYYYWPLPIREIDTNYALTTNADGW